MECNPQTAVKVSTPLKAGAHVADVTSTAIDCRGFEELLVILNAGSFVGDGTAVATVQESSASDGSGDAFATVYAFTALSTSNDDATFLARIKLSHRNRYMRLVYDYTGSGTTNVAPASCQFVLMGPTNSALCTDTYQGNVQV